MVRGRVKIKTVVSLGKMEMEDKLNKSSFTFDIKSMQPALLLLSSSSRKRALAPAKSDQ